MSEYNIYKPNNLEKDETLIWEMLIYRDFIAFQTSDWSMIKDDFIEDGFFGIDGKMSENKSNWNLAFESLESYKKEWLKQSQLFNENVFLEDPLKELFNTTTLSKIEIKNDLALVHKDFIGIFKIEYSDPIIFDWISLFNLKKINGKWKISSFVGYLKK